MSVRLLGLTLLAVLLATPAGAGEGDDTALARELLDGYDDMYRGESSTATMVMNVKTARWERSLRMKVWSKGEEKSIIRIESPAKEAGITTLKVDDNIWNYLPKLDRTMKVPAGMMGGSWMGSHFSNDDLVKESRMADDYTYSITERPSGDTGSWVVECTAKTDAAVVWGKVVVKLRPDRLAESITYWDEKGVLIRTMSFENYTDVDGSLVPLTMRLVPEDKPGEYTEVSYESLTLNADLPDSMFTLQALKK
jgi:outer membrane lipoprotein-sorting protein